MSDSIHSSHRFSLAFAAALLGLTVCAGLAGAQAQKTDYELNNPYICPNGTSYTFTKRTGTGYFSMCYYTIKHNGRLFGKEVSACRQMTGYLRGCKVQNTASAPAGPPVEDWHSRPTHPSYLSAMPYVEKVRSTIKGTSPDDTLARQLTVFTWIPQMITHMREASRPYGSPWTADETKITYVYNLAAKQITDDYAKTHTPAATEALKHAEGHYEMMDDQFYKQWTTALFPADFLNAYNHAYWGMLAQYSAHVDEERKQNEEFAARAKAAQQAAAQGGAGGLPNGPGYVAARRCLELGGTELECLGKGVSASFFGLAGMKPGDLFPTSKYTGLTLTGVYKSSNGIGAGFSDTTVAFGNCGKLIIADRHYTTVKNGSQIVIHVDSSPSAFSFRLEPDGRLVGPPAAAFAGKVVVGYRHYWAYKRYRETGQYVPGSGRQVTEPIYAGRTGTCTIGTLNPAGPSDPGFLADLSTIVGAVTGRASASSGNSQMPPPGIRMAGVYTSQGGLRADFAAASVVLDCGEAHVRDKYTVERAGSQILIHVQNPASPFTATLQPDGSLAAAASVAVAGRLVTGMNGDQVTYAPSNATCSVGRLFPHGATTGVASGSAHTAPRPAASAPVAPVAASSAAGNAALTVLSGFSGGANPLAGRQVFLMKQTMDTVARSVGLHPPAGFTSCQEWAAIGATCHPATKCAPLLSAIGKNVASRFAMPSGSRGAFPSMVPAGTYYIMTTAMVNHAAMCWSVRMNLKPGSNAVTLSTRNGEKLK